MHCLTAWGQLEVELLQYTASLPGGSGKWNSCNTLPDCLGAADSGTRAIHCLTAWGSGQWNSFMALPHCPGALGNATPAMRYLTARGHWAVELMQRLTAWGQWAVDLLLNTASLPGGIGQWSSRSFCNALLPCLGALGNATRAMHCLTAWGSGTAWGQ